MFATGTPHKGHPIPRVLVVDDDESVLRMLAQVLRTRGFDPVSEPGPAEALRTLDTSAPFDAAVIDIRLGSAAGLDLVAAMRDRRLNLPVLVMSGDTTIETTAEAMRLGVVDFLSKPFSGADLVNSIRRAIASDALRQSELMANDQSSGEFARVRAELEESRVENAKTQERHRALVDSLSVLVYEYHLASGQFTHLTGRLAHRVRPGKFPGGAALTLADVIHADDLPWAAPRLAGTDAHAGDAPREALEFRLRTTDESEVWVRAVDSSASTTRAEGTATGVLFDVTESQAARAEQARLELALAAAREELDRRLLRDLDRGSRHEPPSGGAVPTAHVPEFGTSAAMSKARTAVLLAAEHDEPVLVFGETGTGKGMFAEMIHRHSRRSKAPFVALNCAALGGDLLASELFGHSRGAFTSADKARKGLIEEADGGTLFLDEIGEMGLEVQSRLLKVLEEKTFRRLGETTQRKSDFRMICATHRDLRLMTEHGAFRSDLLYRIDVVRVNVPPLRERSEDIVPLARSLLARAGAGAVEFTAESERLLRSLPWKGNVRELRSAVVRASLLARGAPLRAEHFEDFVTTGVPAPPEHVMEPSSPAPELPGGGLDTPEQERTIRDLLARFDGNRTKVARAMGIARSTLYRKLEQMGI